MSSRPVSDPLVGVPLTTRRMNRNCNSFTDELVRRLTGRPAPYWINRAAFVSPTSSLSIDLELVLTEDYRIRSLPHSPASSPLASSTKPKKLLRPPIQLPLQSTILHIYSVTTASSRYSLLELIEWVCETRGRPQSDSNLDHRNLAG